MKTLMNAFLLVCFISCLSINTASAQSGRTTTNKCVDTDCDGDCDRTLRSNEAAKEGECTCTDNNNNQVCDDNERVGATGIEIIRPTKEIKIGSINPVCDGCTPAELKKFKELQVIKELKGVRNPGIYNTKINNVKLNKPY